MGVACIGEEGVGVLLEGLLLHNGASCAGVGAEELVHGGGVDRLYKRYSQI